MRGMNKTEADAHKEYIKNTSACRGVMNGKTMQDIEDVIKVQRSSGNWDYDPYMHGLLNGMLLIESIVKGCRYEPYEKPKRWKYERWYEKIINKITGKNKPISIEPGL